MNNMISKPISSCKTHKIQGKRTLRVIHAAASSPFRPGMRLVASHINKSFSQLQDLVFSSAEAMRLIASWFFGAADVFV